MCSQMGSPSRSQELEPRATCCGRASATGAVTGELGASTTLRAARLALFS